MSQTTTPSGADVLDVITHAACSVAYLAKIRRDAGHALAANIYDMESQEIDQARTAVAALIARNAELEAERDEALRRANRADARVKGWESTMVVRGLPRRICPVEGWGPGEGEVVDIPALTPQKLTEILGRVDALAAENKALRDGVKGLKFDVYELTLPEFREVFDGVKTICVVQMDAVKALREALARTPAAAKGNDACDSENAARYLHLRNCGVPGLHVSVNGEASYIGASPASPDGPRLDAIVDAARREIGES